MSAESDFVTPKRAKLFCLAIGGLVAAFTLAGCGASAPNAALDNSSLALSWRELPDGSFFARNSMPDESAASSRRCWPDETGYDCIVAAELSLASATFISREHEADLPEIGMPLANTSDGYGCQTSIAGPSESIMRNDEELVSNRLDRASPWGAAFVDGYMAENAVTGSAHFACRDILGAVRNGSLETLSTTSITRDMLS